MSSTDYALYIENLTVSFDGFKAVDDVSIYVEKGTVHVVIGPNGAGKTTLLDLVCGKTKPTAGKIKFDDYDLTTMHEQDIVQAGVGRKFQTPSIYPSLTVFENLEVSYPKGRGVWGALGFKRDQEVIDRIHEVADMIYLSDKLQTPGELLSHGQKQWLEIGMLLIADLQMILLDEPVAGMSVVERKQTADLLRKISQNRSILVIEHDMNFVREIAHRVNVMHQGKVIAEGSMETVEKNEKVIEVYLGH
ncbi:MAG: urea ABC transporter ATP-binding protein UrtD [Deltaproteobacteria bacterium]|nr:urea ABC transporter ATP-binding protein UrtD [Deltaproteobacteria bacterium]